MTKEQAAYAAALNLIGSDPLDPVEDALVIDSLGREHRAADHSTHPCVDCPHCYTTVPYNGPADAEHYAELCTHLTNRHDVDAWTADAEATSVWQGAVKTMGVAA